MIRTFTAYDAHTAAHLTTLLGLSAWSTDDYRAEVDNESSVMLVAECGGDVIGFVIGRLVASTRLNSEFDAELLNIGVRPNEQLSGVGKQLLEHFLHAVRKKGAADVWLEVRESNTIARKFYEKAGFSVTGTRKDYYRDPPEDAVVMVKTPVPPKG